MIRLYDVLKNIEQMLVSFKRYIEAFEAGMALQLSNQDIPSNSQVVQAHSMA
jgi:hypothetical protein